MLHAAVLQAGQLYFLQGWVAASQAVTGGLPSSQHVAAVRTHTAASDRNKTMQGEELISSPHE